MMKACTKAEVVQVAENLLEPLLEVIHMDVSNLRAEVVAEGKARVEQDTKLVAATTEVRHRAMDLEMKLQRYERAKEEVRKAVDVVRQTGNAFAASIIEIQRRQASQQSDIGRIDRMLKRLLEEEAKRENNSS